MEEQNNKIEILKRKISKKAILIALAAIVAVVVLAVLVSSQNKKNDNQTTADSAISEQITAEPIKETDKEEHKVKIFDSIVRNQMSSEEMIFAIEAIVNRWKNLEITDEVAIEELKTYKNVKFEEVAVIAEEKIGFITLEMDAKKAYADADDYFHQGLYVEAFEKLKEIPTEYSNYSAVTALVVACQKETLEKVKEPYTVEEYETDIEYVSKCVALFPDETLENRKKELEEELVILKDVLDIILTATEMYDNKMYEEAFAMLAFGLEQYPDNERIEESLVNFHDHFIIQTTNEAVELCKAEAYKEALDVVEAALLEYECDELKILKEQVREEKSPLYKFKNDVVEAFKFSVSRFSAEKLDVKQLANDAGAYVVKSGKTLVLGDYANEEVTVLALTGNVATSLAGVDAFMDIRDLTYDLTHWGEEEYFVAHLAVDVIALIPVVGMIKYFEHYKVVEAGVDAAADMVDSVADVGKNTEATAEAVDAMFTTAKSTYKVIDAADAVKDAAKTRQMAKTIRNNASKGYKFVNTLNYKLLGTKHGDSGVEFVLKRMKYSGGDMIQGVFPVFKSFSDVNLPKDLYKVSFDKQKVYCLEALQKQVKNPFSKVKKNFTDDELADIVKGVLPEGYTWHHNEKEGLMQLVDTVTHDATGHTGGMSLWGIGYN